MAINSLTNLKQSLLVADTADDSLLAQLQAAADSFIETFCGRTFAGGTFTEFHPGGAKILFLNNYPVAGVSSVFVDAAREFDPSTLVPPERYVLHPARGVIECLDGPFVPSLPGWDVPADAFPNAVRVEYTTGVNQVPAAVQRAYTELVSHWYRQTKTAAATGQLNLIEQAGTVYPWGQSVGFKIPTGVKELLRPFRGPAV
ncbi:MAG: phage head-tail connector protein [Fimbriiglobus sp.]|nr:phage head-tail connector protein [Fimbriiglobus sp.]